nr:formate dehydrogenase accessory sulfurtransferase FdhD [Haliscomenobacter sp.]
MHPHTNFDFERLNRHFYTSSSCGICGKASLEMVKTHAHFLLDPQKPQVSPPTLLRLPQLLLPQQSLFGQTGGIHAAGLFAASGDLLPA